MRKLLLKSTAWRLFYDGETFIAVCGVETFSAVYGVETVIWWTDFPSKGLLTGYELVSR